jgi:hypothetical protein
MTKVIYLLALMWERIKVRGSINYTLIPTFSPQERRDIY